MNIDHATLARFRAEGRLVERCAAPAGPVEISEKEFQQMVIDRARQLGWKAYHPFDSRKSDEGYPDTTFARHRVFWAELKVGDNQPTAKQLAWIDALRAAGQTVFVWRPEDWREIERELQR